MLVASGSLLGSASLLVGSSLLGLAWLGLASPLVVIAVERPDLAFARVVGAIICCAP
jgi:hypothetical protein